MNTIEEKIEKGKKIAEIVEDIKQLENISDILNDYINVKIYKNNGINIQKCTKNIGYIYILQDFSLYTTIQVGRDTPEISYPAN